LDKIGQLVTYMKSLSHLQASGALVAVGRTLRPQDVGSDLACHAVGALQTLRQGRAFEEKKWPTSSEFLCCTYILL